MIPPSTRSAAPVIPEDCSEARKTTKLAISSCRRNRRRTEDIPGPAMNSFSKSGNVLPDFKTPCEISASSLGLGPGINAFTVTAVPAAISAKPRARPSTADLQVIHAVIFCATKLSPGGKAAGRSGAEQNATPALLDHLGQIVAS